MNKEINNVFNNDDLIIETSFEDKKINYVYDSLGITKSSNINNLFNMDYEYLNNGNNT